MRAEAASLNADAVFDKPFDVDDLRTAFVNVQRGGTAAASERGKLEEMMNVNTGTHEQRAEPRRECTRPLNVLLADDDIEMRHLLFTQLHADGHVVSTVRDGTEMLEALSEVSDFPVMVPDVIIMDVRMPGYSGLHLLAALRFANWTTPVILITAFGDVRLHAEAARLGAAVVFDKPFDVDDLRAALWRMSQDDADEYIPDGERTSGAGGVPSPESESDPAGTK